MKKLTLYFYLALAAANIIGHYLNLSLLTQISKTLLMPSLALFFIQRWQGKKDISFLFTLIALIFSWIGDVLLMFQHDNNSFFLFGLGAFLLAHITYMFDYYYLQINLGQKQNRTFIVLRVIILAFAGGALLNVLWPHLSSMKIPVVLYTLVIVLMAVFAVLRRDRTSPSSFSFIYGGALLFIVSDGMIAVSRFLQPFNYQSELIMLTYIFAQFFIVKGVLEHNRLVNSPELT